MQPIWKFVALVVAGPLVSSALAVEPVPPTDEHVLALVRCLGGEAKVAITEIDLSESQVTDADLAELKGQIDLDELNLHGTKISDIGVAELAGLKGLQALYLDDTQITDIGAAHLERLTRLESLYLDGTKISDQGLEYLDDLTRLEELSLGYTAITDSGLLSLARLKACDAWRLTARASPTPASLAEAFRPSRPVVARRNQDHRSRARTLGRLHAAQ